MWYSDETHIISKQEMKGLQWHHIPISYILVGQCEAQTYTGFLKEWPETMVVDPSEAPLNLRW